MQKQVSTSSQQNILPKSINSIQICRDKRSCLVLKTQQLQIWRTPELLVNFLVGHATEQYVTGLIKAKGHKLVPGFDKASRPQEF